ncbi:MAG TPA: D-alanine--D-alanine ligase [Bacteroidales bacterium]|nr:D-alanine--D-alanine ligase [Bacteroidales bacterium]HPT01236.1 D-alanine--D-alanine ligase [Bacteroidales bacterium]
MKSKKNIALLMGGDSGEFEVSVASAAVIRRNIDETLYNVYPVLVHAGEWIYTPDEKTGIPVDKNSFSVLTHNERIFFDCAFIAIHGTPGEDGKLQGYLDMAHIPYTSCDLTTSAITFNKYFSNDLALQYGMNVAATVMLRRMESWDTESLIRKVGMPCFVKPNKAGSSCGVTKVYHPEDIEKAVNKAFAEDDEVLVQQFIKGRELACGVFRRKGNIVVLPVTEVIPKNDFFDYEAKYTSGMSEEITPASLTGEEVAECNRITAYLYDKFNCKGVVRFDYFLDNGKFWFLEVNTVPGLSDGSIVPKQAVAAGYSLKEFFGILIEEALAGTK